MAVTQKFGAHVIGQTQPAEQRKQNKQQGDAGLKDGGKNQQQIKLGQRTPYFAEALQIKIDAPAEVTLHGTRQHPQQHADDSQRHAEQHRHAEAVERAGQHVAPAIIGTQPVLRAGPGRIGLLREIVEGIVTVRVERINRPVAGAGKLLANIRVEIIGGSLEIAAESAFRIIA